jgi:hypothetical protein
MSALVWKRWMVRWIIGSMRLIAGIAKLRFIRQIRVIGQYRTGRSKIHGWNL